jgi:hypothetical protein
MLQTIENPESDIHFYQRLIDGIILELTKLGINVEVDTKGEYDIDFNPSKLLNPEERLATMLRIRNLATYRQKIKSLVA